MSLNKNTAQLDKEEEVEVSYMKFSKAFDSINNKLLF